jgi:DNA-binding NtrC family response regulator
LALPVNVAVALDLGGAIEMSSARAMVVSHDLGTQQAVAGALRKCGCAPIVTSTLHEAITILKRHSASLVFCSDDLPEGGVENFIRQASRPPNGIAVVVVSRHDDWKRYVEFLQTGAFDYVLVPPNGDEIERIARTVLHQMEPMKHVVSA